MTIAALVLVSACSSDSKKSVIDAPPHLDVSSIIDGPRVDGGGVDAMISEGGCAACTANMCLPTLQACGASQACVNDLVTFNNCLGAHGTMCGTPFGAAGTLQSNLWVCLMTMCAPSCGTM